jgi:hypothetical protein
MAALPRVNYPCLFITFYLVAANQGLAFHIGQNVRKPGLPLELHGSLDFKKRKGLACPGFYGCIHELLVANQATISVYTSTG